MFLLPSEYLRHISDEAEYLINAGLNLSFEKFAQDETLKRAFVRSIEIIGEATKKLPENLIYMSLLKKWMGQKAASGVNYGRQVI